MNYLLSLLSSLIAFGLFTWAALKVASKANEKAKKTEREKYQHRNDVC
jgi:F0F1-type ATP synthase membrane subunit b/b'